MNKIAAFWTVLRLGHEVSDPALWKDRQAFGNKIGALILAVVFVAKMMGYELSFMDQDTALVFGGFIATVFNIVLTYATSKKVGLLPPKPEATLRDGPADPVQPVEQPAVPTRPADNTYFG